jgi:putative CocE/NonD family hydrolase
MHPALMKSINEKQTWYLSSDNGNANDVFHSGKLTRNKPGSEKPDRFEYDPLDPISEEHVWFTWVDVGLDQTDALSGENLVYHSPRLEEDLEVSGFITFNAYLSLNVPDTDLEAALYEIKPNGTGIFLTFTLMRARCRNSISTPTLVKPGEINLYRFDTFNFFSRRLSKGSRLRLVFGPVKNPYFEKNYNSGGVVAEETAKDARKAVITLYHDKKHPSSLILPIYKTTKDNRDKKF